MQSFWRTVCDVMSETISVHLFVFTYFCRIMSVSGATKTKVRFLVHANTFVKHASLCVCWTALRLSQLTPHSAELHVHCLNAPKMNFPTSTWTQHEPQQEKSSSWKLPDIHENMVPELISPTHPHVLILLHHGSCSYTMSKHNRLCHIQVFRHFYTFQMALSHVWVCVVPVLLLM